MNAVYQARDCAARLRLLNLQDEKLPFPVLLISLKTWGKQYFHTRTPMYFGITAHEVLKQKILRQETYCCLIWEFFRPLLFLLCWRRGTFHMYYVNGEKKHSTAGTPILATRFWRVSVLQFICQHSKLRVQFWQKIYLVN